MVDLSVLDDNVIVELAKFSKDVFDVETIIATASDLKYTRALRRLIASEFANPSEDFIRFFVGKVYDGRLTRNVREQFGGIIRRAFLQFVNGKIADRLKSALRSESDGGQDASLPTEKPVETTPEEWQGFYIVQAILAREVGPERVVIRDAKSYCSVILDNNNRKPVCRLWFNSAQKYLGLLDENKVETRHPIARVNDIYRFSADLLGTASRYGREPRS